MKTTYKMTEDVKKEEQPVDVSAYSVTNHYRGQSDENKARMKAFLIENKLVQKDTENIDQLLELIVSYVETDGMIVGYTSVSVIKGARENLLYSYSMFVAEGHRSQAMRAKVMSTTFNILCAWEVKLLPQKPTGVLIQGPDPVARKLGRPFFINIIYFTHKYFIYKVISRFNACNYNVWQR